MFRIVQSKTKKEVRRERAQSDMNRSTIFSVYFTRTLLLLCVLLLGVLIGINVNEKLDQYGRDRQLTREEEDLLARMKVNHLRSEQELVQSPDTAVAQPPTAEPETIPVVAPAPQPVVPPSPSPSPAPPEIPSLGAGVQPGVGVAAAPTEDAQFNEEFALLQAKREEMERKFADMSVTPGVARPGQPGDPAAGIGGGPEADAGGPSAFAILPEQLVVEETTTQITPAQQKILDQPGLAKVVEYNTEWQFVVLDAGSRSNISSGRKLAVRRGSKIVGIVEVDEVDEQSCTAELMGRDKSDPKVPKPEPGDDVIAYPLF